MNKSRFLRVILICCFCWLIVGNASTCTMYKVSANGKTFTGSNYDAYFLTPRIWFENANSTYKYGAVFSGARNDGMYGFAPQSGMNEFGLAFSGAAVPMSEKYSALKTGKKQITSRTLFLKDVLHSCKTVEEVQTYLNQFDRRSIDGDIFLYVDKSGKYLIVEPDTMILGQDSSCVLSNFCPTITKEIDALKMTKYRNGVEFLKNKTESNITFCRALSDTMHVCRKKIGDGTLLTCIRDLNEGILYYYFYHDFSQAVKINLKEELAKGDHVFEVPELFPPNAEFKKLINYKTPINNKFIRFFLFSSVGIFFFSSFFFLVSYFKRRKIKNYSTIKLILAPLDFMFVYYSLALIIKENIFYFPAPYQDYKFGLLDIASYLPYLLLLLIGPLCYYNWKILKENAWHWFGKWLFLLNNFVFLVLIVLFIYWGFYSIV